MINGVPPINPNFDRRAVMTVADLLAQNFGVVGSWQVVNGQMTIVYPQPDEGPVATCVGIGRRVFGRHEAIRSRGEVNYVIVWLLGEGLPSVDLAHGDLS